MSLSATKLAGCAVRLLRAAPPKFTISLKKIQLSVGPRRNTLAPDDLRHDRFNQSFFAVLVSF